MPAEDAEGCAFLPLKAWEKGLPRTRASHFPSLPDPRQACHSSQFLWNHVSLNISNDGVSQKELGHPKSQWVDHPVGSQIALEREGHSEGLGSCPIFFTLKFFVQTL